MARALGARTAEILAANATDVARAKAAGTPDHIIDRLSLDERRVAGMADGLRQVAGLPDPVGAVMRGSVLPNGLELRQIRVPLGVVGIIYEARPNVTVDAAGLCLKSGNATLLRGSSSARTSNDAIVTILRDAIAEAGLPADAVQLVDASSRESVEGAHAGPGTRRRADPTGRRGPDPVGGRGVDRSRDRDRRRELPCVRRRGGRPADGAGNPPEREDISARRCATRPSRCSCTSRWRTSSSRSALPALREAGVQVHGDPAVVEAGDANGVDVSVADESDYAAEYLSLDLSAAVVPSLDAAIVHIRQYGSGHTEAIVTRSQAAARRFVAEVDAASVVVNASTRFTDGEEFGFGAEIGISTQKLHARGPMGLPELTSTKFVVVGDGHIRTDPR